MKAEDFATSIMNFFNQVERTSNSSQMRSFVSDSDDGSIYMDEDPLETHQETLQDAINKYGFVAFDEMPRQSIIGNISKYGRNHQILKGKREDNEFPYDFLIIVEAPLPIRIWCQDFSDFINVMLILKDLFI